MGLFRTILRRSFYAAAAVSTLLLLATLILWPVSYYRELNASYFTAGGDKYALAADSGRAYVSYISGSIDPCGWHFWAVPPEMIHWSYLSWNTRDPDILAPLEAPTFLGVSWFYLPPIPVLTDHGALVPCSYLALLFSILPLLAFRSIRRRGKAARIGLCPKCGYDLRAQHAGSGGAVCPECGTPVAGRGPSPGGEGRPV